MKAMELQTKKQYLLKLEAGDEIVAAIKKFAEEKDIRAGTIDFGLGGFTKLVAGYVDVDEDGTAKLPTHFTEEEVFDLTPKYDSGSGCWPSPGAFEKHLRQPYETPDHMPYKDVLFAGDISIVKKKDGTMDRVVHIHLSEGGPTMDQGTPRLHGFTSDATSLKAFGGDHEHHTYYSVGGEHKTAHVLNGLVGPYADVKITSYKGSLVREINPETKVSEIMRYEPSNLKAKLQDYARRVFHGK